MAYRFYLIVGEQMVDSFGCNDGEGMRLVLVVLSLDNGAASEGDDASVRQ